MPRLLTITLALGLSMAAAWPPAVLAKSPLDMLYDSGFQQIIQPRPNDLKTLHAGKRMPHADFDRVWDSVLTIVMQHAIIVRCSREQGMITAFNGIFYSVLVTRGKLVLVYAEGARPRNFFDTVTTQVYGLSKWTYLK